jgi:hypothetical protein
MQYARGSFHECFGVYTGLLSSWASFSTNLWYACASLSNFEFTETDRLLFSVVAFGLGFAGGSQAVAAAVAALLPPSG